MVIQRFQINLHPSAAKLLLSSCPVPRVAECGIICHKRPRDNRGSPALPKGVSVTWFTQKQGPHCCGLSKDIIIHQRCQVEYNRDILWCGNCLLGRVWIDRNHLSLVTLHINCYVRNKTQEECPQFYSNNQLMCIWGNWTFNYKLRSFNVFMSINYYVDSTKSLVTCGMMVVIVIITMEGNWCRYWSITRLGLV